MMLVPDKLMPMPSQLYRLIEERLDTSLDEYVAAHKDLLSWRAMSRDLTARTGIVVSSETLRLWYVDRLVTVVVPAAGRGTA